MLFAQSAIMLTQQIEISENIFNQEILPSLIPEMIPQNKVQL